MKLIAGLGNPGQIYNGTRHNVGFVVVDELAKIFGVDFHINKKFHSEIAEIKISNKKIILLKPLTYMNESGLAVLETKKFFKINPKDILIIHDDKDIALGEHKLQANRSSAGHNGVQSIINYLDTKLFFRLRLGIKPVAEIKDTADFVLKKFTAQEKKLINEKIIQVAKIIADNLANV